MNASYKPQQTRQYRIAVFRIFFLLATALNGVAQTPEVGFFTIVNAVDLATNTIVSVDGKALRPDGLKPMQVTGGLGFVAGAHRLTATNGNCVPATLSLPVSASTSPIVIVYQISGKNAAGLPTQELRMFPQNNANPTDKKAFYAVYAGAAASQSVSINGKSTTLQSLKEVPLGSFGSLEITQNGRPVGHFNADEPENYLAVIFDKRNSELSSLLVKDLVFKPAGRR